MLPWVCEERGGDGPTTRGANHRLRLIGNGALDEVSVDQSEQPTWCTSQGTSENSGEFRIAESEPPSTGHRQRRRYTQEVSFAG